MLVRLKELSDYGRYLLVVLMAVSLAAMPATNSWDVRVYTVVYLIVAVLSGGVISIIDSVFMPFCRLQ